MQPQSLKAVLKFRCNQKPSDMQKTNRGYFCGQCQTEVTDFTSFSNEDFKIYFNNYSKEKKCGMFLPTQVKMSVKEKSFLTIPEFFIKTAGILSAIALPLTHAHGQLKNAQVETNINPSQSSKIGKDTLITVKGNVFASVNNKNEPLTDASITIAGTALHTIVSADGHFEIQNVPLESTMEISMLGFITQKIKIVEGTKVYSIVLDEDKKRLDDMVVLGGYWEFSRQHEPLIKRFPKINIGKLFGCIHWFSPKTR